MPGCIGVTLDVHGVRVYVHVLVLDNYSKGVRLAKTAEKTSNLETDSEKENKRKRKKVHLTSDDSEGVP